MHIDEACRAFRRAHLLGEPVDPTHLASCVECGRYRDADRAIAGIVGAHAPRATAPAGLRERVAGAIEAEREARRRNGGSRRTLLVGAIGGVAAAAGALAIWRRRADEGTRRARATAGLIVEDHLEFARRADRVQRVSTSPRELEGWFLDQLDLAVTVPELQRAPLVGGRRCNLGGRPAALAFYDRGGAPVSLFVLEPGGEDWSCMEEVTGLGWRARHFHARGVGVIVWEERGLLHALAAALDTDELRDLLVGA